MSKRHMVELEDAQRIIAERSHRITETEMIPVFEAGGRVIAEDILAPEDNPPFDRSPVDGYAVRAEDTKGASDTTPVYLKVSDEILSGDIPEKTLKMGEAIKIMTGAMLPPGADAVVMVEKTDGGRAAVNIYQEVKPYANYVPAGEDYRKGDVLLRKGEVIYAFETGLLASLGRAEVKVYRKQKVSLLVAGDGIDMPGVPLKEGHVYNTNLFLLGQRIKEIGGDLICADQVGMSVDELSRRIKECAAVSDLVITTGGVSAGESDILPDALRDAGAEILYDKIALKPGTPTTFSVLDGVPVINLSGNPFAAFVCFELLYRVSYSVMTGVDVLPECIEAVLTNAFEKPSKRRRFIRAIYREGQVTFPPGSHSSGTISSMRGCNCLIDVPAGSGQLAPGNVVKALLLYS